MLHSRSGRAPAQGGIPAERLQVIGARRALAWGRWWRGAPGSSCSPCTPRAHPAHWAGQPQCDSSSIRPLHPTRGRRCGTHSLVCRTFDAGLAEVCHEEGVALLAYSPLAMGLLTVRGGTPHATQLPSCSAVPGVQRPRAPKWGMKQSQTPVTMLLHAQGKYLAPGGGPLGARLNKYKGRYAEAESRYVCVWGGGGGGGRDATCKRSSEPSGSTAARICTRPCARHSASRLRSRARCTRLRLQVWSPAEPG